MTTSKVPRMCVIAAALFLVCPLLPSSALAAQNIPPGQGTMALEGTMKKFYRAANVVVVTTIDGVEHIYHFTKDLVVHGGKGSGIDALADLKEGSTVVVHYTIQGAEQDAREVDVVGEEGLEVTEGTVVGVDRGRRQITVRYDNGKSDMFQLTERVASEGAQNFEQALPGGSNVIIFYSDEHGKKVVHAFRRVSK